MNTISTMKFFYQLIQPEADLFSLNMVDVRDVALAHVNAIVSNGGGTTAHIVA